MSVDETRADALVAVAGVLAFEKSDLVGYVAHRGGAGLGGEILDCDSATVVGQKFEHS
jgi:hypothetical protein